MLFLCQTHQPSALRGIGVADGSALDGKVLRDHDEAAPINSRGTGDQPIAGKRFTPIRMMASSQCPVLAETPFVAEEGDSLADIEPSPFTLFAKFFRAAHRRGVVHALLKLIQ